MPWGRLDDSLYDHPKLDALGDARLPAIGLWTIAISWCNRRLTDGRLSAQRVTLLGGTPEIAEALVTAGLFDHDPDGYVIHDFLEFNDSREAVLARRADNARRQRESRDRSRSQSHTQSQRDSGVTNGVTSSVSQGTPSRPVPSYIPSYNVTAHELRVTDKAYKALLERFRFTGKWTDDRWPEPAWEAAWGARP